MNLGFRYLLPLCALLLLPFYSDAEPEAKNDHYSVWMNGERVATSYTTDVSNPDGKQIIVWAVPEELLVERGGSFSITGYFQNATDGILYLPDLNEWRVTIKTSGQIGFSRQGAGHAHLEPWKIEPGETIRKTITLEDPKLGGDFVQVIVHWGVFEIHTEKIYLRRTPQDQTNE